MNNYFYLFQIIFCNTSGDVLCIGTIPIKPLASNTSLSITCSLNQSSCITFGGVVDTPTVNVTLTLQKDQVYSQYINSLLLYIHKIKYFT